MNFIKEIDGGFSVIENLKVSGAREGKYGVTIIVSPNSTASAVFTSNKVVAAPVKYTQNVLKKGIISAVFVNSGNANCFTGQQGFEDCETLVELARQNDKIVGITAAMLQGTSMNKLKEAFPERTFDVGIAEGHAVTFSGGLAKEGMQPFCAIYSSFLQRAYDHIAHDVAFLKLPVVICIDRAGIVGEDGPTHHGMLDMAALRPIPNLTISSPMNEMELRNLMFTAQLPDKGPFVIRYPRGRGVNTNWRQPMEELPIGKGRQLKDGSDMAVITIGPIGNIAADAIVKAEKDKEAFKNEILKELIKQLSNNL